MARTWRAKPNPPLRDAEDLCDLCGRRWPKAELVEQRGKLVCQRPSCLDEPNPKTGER